MSSMFSPKIPKPEAVKPVRMPTEQDPNVLAAAQRTRENVMKRMGRQSTIMTDSTRATTGSSGAKLGA